jgi:hypothetical protein
MTATTSCHEPTAQLCRALDGEQHEGEQHEFVAALMPWSDDQCHCFAAVNSWRRCWRRAQTAPSRTTATTRHMSSSGGQKCCILLAMDIGDATGFEHVEQQWQLILNALFHLAAWSSATR